MTYCEKYGFDEDRRAEFLRLLDLTVADLALANELIERVITPNVDTIVKEFYSYMQQQPEFLHLIAKRRIDLTVLNIMQQTYLLSLGQDFTSREYFEKRLRIGIAHAWNQVPLSQYLGGYRILQQLITNHIPQDKQTPEWRDNMRAYLLKILALDMLLAVETYHEVQINTLENTVRTLRHEEARLKIEVAVDQLTGLSSRIHALNELSRQLEETQSKNRPLSLIMADLDHFKEVNDDFGHQIGDQVLVGIASRIKSCVRDIDTVGRYGGEEIVIILPRADADMAQHIAERIRQKIASSPFGIGEYRINMTISEGISTMHAQDTVDTLIMRADAALYTAKRTGRNRIVIEL